MSAIGSPFPGRAARLEVGVSKSKAKQTDVAIESNGMSAEDRLHTYVQRAISQAVYETLEDDGSVYAEIPGFAGVFANAPTQAECEQQLAEVLEDWVRLRLGWGRSIPVLDGVSLSKA